ncbi:MAG TPA: RNA polymerase sigma factor [Candidatus Micrarchaeaceae archaeon]|nr:RNA polymerase sigma factor [Candidatus Micrarchaeaceae archaeon]
MSTRWFGTQREPKHADLHLGQPQLSADPSGRSIFSRAEGFWRAWLATGARRVPIDRRRARGAEPYLKKILVGAPSGAVDFSSAMARQAIDEALHELPPQHKQVVKLAYFGGLTNREIAEALGLTVSEVRRSLRGSLAVVGARFERGRAKGRRAIQDLLLLPWWRFDGVRKAPWPALDHALQTGIVVVMTAAAAALLVTHQAPVHAGHTHRAPHAAAAVSAGSNRQSHNATPQAVLNPSPRPPPVANAAGGAGSVAAMPAKVESLLSLPVSVTVPPILPNLQVPGLPQLPFGE